MIIEFSNDNSTVFDEIVDILQRQEDCTVNLINSEKPVFSFVGWEFYPNQRKILYNQLEINLSVKEFDIFFLLASNRGRVITYERIYNTVWGDMAFGAEKNAINCQIRNIRKKINAVTANSPITIRCERNIGYCLDFNPKVKQE